jgi:hypothetical protein
VCPTGQTCIPTADPLCQPDECALDWTCGGVQPTCGTSGPLANCLCDQTVEGAPFCWEDAFCDNSPLCANTTDCPAGWACVTSCCGTSCLPACNAGLQGSLLRSTESSGPTAAGNN